MQFDSAFEIESRRLLQCFRTGDRAAGDCLVSRYQNLARSLAWRYAGHNFQDYEELEASAFVFLAEGFALYDAKHNASFATFLAVYMTWKLQTLHKYNTRNGGPPTLQIHEESEEFSIYFQTDDIADRCIEGVDLKRALSHLTPLQRYVVRRRACTQETYREIADHITAHGRQMGQERVRQILAVSFAKIRNLLDEGEVNQNG